VIPSILASVFVFLFGLIIGSFLNVCILRIPGGKSIVTPASACPGCGAPIKPYDNIPVLSWLLLRGKCRACRKPISAMYPAVELLTGLLFLVCWLAFGFSAQTLKWAAFSALMIVLIFTDLRASLIIRRPCLCFPFATPSSAPPPAAGCFGSSPKAISFCAGARAWDWATSK
jgi:leader peptidase (prepilin peptidase)/N-methyltransferase